MNVVRFTNNHSQRVELLVLAVNVDEGMVYGNSRARSTGVEQPLGLRDYRNGEDVADRLRILANTDREPGYEVDEFVGLEEGERGDGASALPLHLPFHADELSMGRDSTPPSRDRA